VKRPMMAAEAEAAIAGTGWLPRVLKSAGRGERSSGVGGRIAPSADGRAILRDGPFPCPFHWKCPFMDPILAHRLASVRWPDGAIVRPLALVQNLN
jgi:hypothetical protein